MAKTSLQLAVQFLFHTYLRTKRNSGGVMLLFTILKLKACSHRVIIIKLLQSQELVVEKKLYI